MGADAINTNNGQIQNNNFIKPKDNTVSNQPNTETTKQISVFSTYDTDKNTNVDKNDTKTKSLFKLNTSALNANKPASMADNDKSLAAIRQAAIGKVNVQNMFTSLVDKFNFHVGKETIVQKNDEDISVRQQTVAGTLNNKVETAANQENISINQKISDAYQQALDEIAKELANTTEKTNLKGLTANVIEGEPTEIDNPEGYGDNIGEDGKNKHSSNGDTKIDKTTTEVFSSYDTAPKDKHVKYNEVGSTTFSFTSQVNSHVDTTTEGGYIIDAATNYDVKTEFEKLAQQFDANVGSETIKTKGENVNQSDINKAQQELDKKANDKAKQYNDKINKQVANEKGKRLEQAYQQYLKDPKSVEVQVLDNQGAVADTDFKGEVKDVPNNYEAKRTDTEDYKPAGNDEATQLVSKTLDTLLTNLFDLDGNTTDYGSKEVRDGKESSTFDKNKFAQYKKYGVSPAIARFMADSANGVTPAAYDENGKITKVTVKNDNGQTITMNVKDLEDYINKDKEV
ncbi:MAG: hypothetical protein ACI4S3_06305 [Candidatus Gastranaerophilaceae bacterium]